MCKMVCHVDQNWRSYFYWTNVGNNYFFGSKAFELKLNSQKKLIIVKDTVSEIFIE